MSRSAVFFACFGLLAVVPGASNAQAVSVYQTTPDLLEALSVREKLHFSLKASTETTVATITVDDWQRFQAIHGFGPSLTDSAAWLFAKKLPPAQTDAAFKMLFSRKDGIALSFLRQPVGSSDLAVTFYSFDDLCQQTANACTTPNGKDDSNLDHFSLAHDQEYILPQLKKALALNPSVHVMLTPWSPPGWMKTTASMLGTKDETKEAAALRPEYYAAFAHYLVKTIEGYQAAGVPIWALSVQNEPLFATPPSSGIQMLPPPP